MLLQDLNFLINLEFNITWLTLHDQCNEQKIKKEHLLLYNPTLSYQLCPGFKASIFLSKGGKFLKKLWCCVGGSITR